MGNKVSAKILRCFPLITVSSSQTGTEVTQKMCGENVYQQCFLGLLSINPEDRGGGGVVPHEGDGVIVGNLKRTPLRNQNFVLWSWSKQIFTTRRYHK